MIIKNIRIFSQNIHKNKLLINTILEVQMLQLKVLKVKQ